MKPFLKWAGGKNQLLPYIEAYYPFEDKNINKYAEPFIDLHPFSWTEVIKQLFGNGSGILPDSFLLI